MNLDAVVLENEILRLPRVEQALLADRLLQALSEPDPQIMEAWVSEGERRLEEFHAGRMPAEDGMATIQSLRKQFG
jgi:putative addiction module component (TIGR02574 family)